MNKEEREEKLIEWLNMDIDEKRKFNGWEGFLNGNLFKDNNLFMSEMKDKAIRKANTETERRKKQNEGKIRTD